MRPMTISALCLYLDISRQGWSEYCAKQDFSDITKHIETVIYKQKFAGAAADLLNANIIARELGLADKKELSGADAVMNAAMDAQQAITDILNMHAPVMGAQGNETSGVAIQKRQQQSETAQFHFQDNLNKSIRHSSRILLEVYRAVYDTEVVRRIIGMDGEASMTKLNAQPTEQNELKRPALQEQAEQRILDKLKAEQQPQGQSVFIFSSNKSLKHKKTPAFASVSGNDIAH